MAAFKDKTILITGGASGIGLALAQRFLSAGNTVIICGRREDALLDAKRRFPALHIRTCDVSIPAERVALFEWVVDSFPLLDVLVNNAGVQRRVDLSASSFDHSEIAINLEAPIHLCMLFSSYLSKRNGCIINVTFGLAFSPLAAVPVYSATKAAMHSFTLSLRHQLKSVRVVELLPPAVNTDLGGKGLHDFGEPLDKFADAVFLRLQAGELEIAHGFAAEAIAATPQKSKEIFERMNKG